MDFDFYQQYKDYSNIDLLKIVKQPENYQPAAVAAAENILSERQLSAEEISTAEQYFTDIENSEKDKKEKIDALKNKVADFLEPVLSPKENIEPNKWLNILLLVIALQYVWTLYKTVKHLILFLKCKYCYADISIVLGVITLLYVPLIFTLLFKKRRWGWILLFFDNLFFLITRVSESYIFFKYQSVHHGDTASFLVPILIRIAFACFLWRDSIANHFGITHETKKNTTLITSATALLFILIINLLSE